MMTSQRALLHLSLKINKPRLVLMCRGPYMPGAKTNRAKYLQCAIYSEALILTGEEPHCRQSTIIIAALSKNAIQN